MREELEGEREMRIKLKAICFAMWITSKSLPNMLRMHYISYIMRKSSKFIVRRHA